MRSRVGVVDATVGALRCLFPLVWDLGFCVGGGRRSGDLTVPDDRGCSVVGTQHLLSQWRVPEPPGHLFGGGERLVYLEVHAVRGTGVVAAPADNAVVRGESCVYLVDLGLAECGPGGASSRMPRGIEVYGAS